MAYGDNGGAIGYLVGEENNGLACMFTMMNEARLKVGLQGLGATKAPIRRRSPMRASAFKEAFRSSSTQM